MRRVAEALNGLSDEALSAALSACCGSARWALEMSAHHPFTDDEAVFTTADRIWVGLNAEDWLEAFAHHPRIGGRMPSPAPEAERSDNSAGRDWARNEQSGMMSAGNEVRRRIVRGNQEYEEEFGYVFLICATGRSADEMLAELEERLTHDAATELRIAAAEQAKITRLRLQKLADA